MKLVYVDMDDTIADFRGADPLKGEPYDEFSVRKMYDPGFFYNLKPINGALSGVRGLIRLGFDVHILSQPVAESPHSYSEKVQWIALYFPELIRKLHFTQDKGLFYGDYLIDDNPDKWKDRFKGQFVEFRYGIYNEWENVLTYMKEKL